METLIFQLQGPISSWGDTAVGEYRPSAEYPGQSAIFGLLAAALGIEREDDPAHAALRASVRMAVGVVSPGRLLRDFHTAQVPSRSQLKKRPHATRRDELSVPKQDLNTILSTRDYRQDASSLVALQACDGAVHSLSDIADALRMPRFLLYLGRKSCPLAAPLHPCLSEVENIEDAMRAYLHATAAGRPVVPWARDGAGTKLTRIAWGDEFGTDDEKLIGRQHHISVVRKDRVLARRGWQFGDRQERIALLDEE